MDKKTIGLGIVIACVILAGILIIVVVGGLYPFVGERNTGMMMDSDRMFIEQMIPHHQDAVEMGELALVKAEHPEIKQLAGNIIRDQSREISQMRDWYRLWYGTDVPVYQGMTGGGMGMMGSGSGMMGMGGNMTDLSKLENATQFDKEFIEQMIPHHQMAIMMARMTQNSAHPEMRELGNSIIRSQSAEVDMMQEWYRNWYGEDVFTSGHMMGMNQGSLRKIKG